MFEYIILFLLALIVLLFPIPLKITLKYSNKVMEIYLYNKQLKSKKKLEIDLENNNLESIIKENFFSSLIFSNIKIIIYKIKRLKFKPTVTLNTKLEYGFDDAAFVAILFGLIHSIYSFLYLALINFVKVKTTNFKVIPHFEENDFNMEILSVIYINLAKTIYIAFVMLPCFIKIIYNKTNVKKFKGGNVHG